jgi:chromosomal replication initiation ATPase DnaA
MRAAPSVAIREPDEQLLSALLVKHFSDRQIRVNADVLHYILPRIERSFEAVRDLVEAADRKALVEKRKISIPLMREIINPE